VVNEAVPPCAEQQKGTVFNGTHAKHVDDGEGVFGESALSVPLFEVAEGDAFLLQCGSDEGEFVLFGLARDEVALPQQTFLGRDQRHSAARPFGDGEGEQRALRHESFVTEGKHSPLINDIANLLTVRQQTRKVFSVIGHQVVEEGRLNVKLYLRNMYCAEGDEILEQFRMDVVSVVKLILEEALILVPPLLVLLL